MRGSRSARSASSSPSTKAGSSRAGVPCTDALSLSETSPPAVPRKMASCSCACSFARTSPMGRLRHATRLQAGLNLRNRIVVVLPDQVGDVPVEGQLHARHAAAFDGVGNDHLRPAFAGRLQSIEGAEDRREVMPIDAPDVPAEAAEAVRQRLDLHDLFSMTVDAELVAVDD